VDHIVEQGSLRVCCDGKLALERVEAMHPIIITEPHTDLLSAIRKVKTGIKCHLSFKHVCGHQDVGQPMVLEQDATLIMEMDTQAKRKIEDTPEAVSYEIPFEGWLCYIGTRKIIKQCQLTLWEHINGKPICQHWQCKHKFGTSASDQVDWTSVAEQWPKPGGARGNGSQSSLQENLRTEAICGDGNFR